MPFPNIANVNVGSYLYINQNQKTINKIQDNVKSVYKTGIRDGYYKVLGNIPVWWIHIIVIISITQLIIIEVPYTTLTDYDVSRRLNYGEVFLIK